MSKLLPFPLHQGGDAAWRHMATSRLDLTNGYYGATQRSENDYDVELSVMTNAHRVTAPASVTVLIVVSDCLVNETRSRRKSERYSKAPRAIPGQCVGMTGNGYVVIDPLTTSSNILKWFWPQLAASELDQTELLVDIMLSTFDEDTKTILQRIENERPARRIPCTRTLTRTLYGIIIDMNSSEKRAAETKPMAQEPLGEDDAFLNAIARILDPVDSLLELPSLSVDALPSGDLALLGDSLSLSFLEGETEELEPTGTKDKPIEERAAPPSRSTACRKRQREELEHLRNQVCELEAQLETLRKTTRTGSPTPSDRSSTHARDAVVSPSVMWEKIAMRQVTAKQKAEAENAKLRDMLEGQLKIARGLERVLRKRSSVQMDVEALESKRRKRADSTDADVYARLRLGLDARYREVVAAFQQNGMATNRMDFNDTRVISSHDERELGVEILFAKVLPFGFASTCAAFWNSASMSYVQLKEGDYWAQAGSADELTAKFEVPLTVRQQPMTLHTYAVMKRFRESDEREVYVLEAWSIIRSTFKIYDGIHSLDHGWTVVETLETKDPANPATIVQSCLRLMSDEQTLPRQSPISALSDVLLVSYIRNYAMLHETVENMLVGSTLG